MRIAIYGATGAVGSTLLVHLFKGVSLRPGTELILVGRDAPSHSSRLLATQTDLLDAFDAGIIQISVCLSFAELPPVDLFVMCAGETIGERYPNRHDLAETNAPIFLDTAAALFERSPDCLVLIVSNPVELGVMLFTRFFSKECIFGMGAQQDSLRFARAVANHLELPRSSVRATVVGEHGPGMIPLWSSVHLVDVQGAELDALDAMRSELHRADAHEPLEGTPSSPQGMLSDQEVKSTYQRLSATAPELRVKLEPLLTTRILHSTPNATANATMECIQALIEADDRTIHGQVVLSGEFEGIHGVFGVPIRLRREGWSLAPYARLSDDERAAVARESARLSEQYSGY